MKSLLAGSQAGLCNRIRVMISAQYLARTSGRRFVLFWPVSKACGARFGDLFENRVTTIDRVPSALEIYQRDQAIEKAMSSESTVCFKGYSYLVPDHDRFLCTPDYDALRPVAAVQNAVDRVQAKFDSGTIGVHMRRRDFKSHFLKRYGRSLPTITEYCAAIDKHLKSTLFLSTDDHVEVERAVRQRFGDRVITFHKEPSGSASRSTVIGMRDAVIDLWLLRRTAMVVGTHGSSFSSLAAWERSLINVGGARSVTIETPREFLK